MVIGTKQIIIIKGIDSFTYYIPFKWLLRNKLKIGTNKNNHPEVAFYESIFGQKILC